MERALGRRQPAIQGRFATLAVLAVTVCAVIAAAYLSTPNPRSDGGVTAVNVAAGPGDAPRIGSLAPQFVATDASGRTVSLTELRGRRVWLTFGASWCQSCRAENPDIEAVWRRHDGSDLAIVAVFLSEDAAAVRDYSGRVSLTYTTIPDPDTALASAYRIVGLPSHFFIDREGYLRKIRIGSLTPDGMEAALEEIDR